MRRRRTKSVKANVDKLTFQDVMNLEGKVKLYRCENGGYGQDFKTYFPVKVVTIYVNPDDTTLRAVVEPVNGVGRFDAMISDLVTREEAKREQIDETREQQANDLVSEVTDKSYTVQKRAAFVAFMNKHATPEELKNITEEIGGKLERASVHDITRFTYEVARRVMGLPVKSGL